MSSKLVLFKKEWMQNRFLYMFPLPFAFLLVSLRISGHLALIPSWVFDIMAFAVPLILAIAYGLQGFDVEEDAQTRDFLLVKPLTVWRIVIEKFFAGLVILLFWTCLFAFTTYPKVWTWPIYNEVASWIGFLLVVTVLLTYGASFLGGLWVKGPKKLLAAGGLSILSFIIFFGTLSSIATLLWHTRGLHPTISSMVFFITGLLIFGFLLCCIGFTMVWILRQRPQLQEDKPFLCILALVCLLPITSVSANLLQRPVLRIAYFAGLEIFGLDEPFWVEDGAWQSESRAVAVVGANNTLGFAQIGSKPYILYRGHSEQNPISDLAWSPDGNYLAFRDGDQLLVWTKELKEPINLLEGSSPCWSRDSQSLVFVKNITQIQVQTPKGPINLQRLELYKADFKRNIAEPYQTLEIPSNTWSWDSISNRFYTFLSDGHLIAMGHEKPLIFQIPELNPEEFIFMGRILPDFENNSLMLLTYSTDTSNLNDNPNYSKVNLRLYRFDIADSQFHIIMETTALKHSSVIMGQDLSFWGHNGVFQVIP